MEARSNRAVEKVVMGTFTCFTIGFDRKWL